MSSPTTSHFETAVMIRRILFFLVLISFTLLNLMPLFRGLSSPQAMEQAQIARQIARGEGFTTKMIRPLAYCAEDDIAAYAAWQGYPIMPCNLCGSQETLQRQAIKAMLADWERKTPGRVDNVFRALADVRPSQLADRNLFDFAALGAAAAPAASVSDWLAGEPADTRAPFPIAVVAAN